MNQILFNTIATQTNQQDQLSYKTKKDNGVFFTNEIKIVDSILDIIEFDNGIINKKILEPAVGNGIFLLRILERAHQYYPDKEKIHYFIENGLYFVDIDPEMTKRTKENISNLYENFFGEKYKGKFNSFIYDFTEKVKNDLSLFNEIRDKNLELILKNVDYVVGNPPYVSLYGRRDRKKNEMQRMNYLHQYRQFPKSLKNGKINYVMLFIEHSLDYLKKNGKLSFVIDISFFETAYKHTRKYLLENTKIDTIENNISNFDGVASGQLIIKVENDFDNKNVVKVKNFFTEKIQEINQNIWFNENDEYRFRLNFSDITQNILDKMIKKSPMTLKKQFHKKELRTCTMLLDMEKKFVDKEQDNKRGCKKYKYYQGSKALYSKYCTPFTDRYFYHDKKLQDKINNDLKEELIKKGIKNKKRIGLGDFLVYDHPKIFIRQSAKELIATYDESPSSANNSLYVFSLRARDIKTKKYLQFLCGFLNSAIATFYAQKMEIIRYRKGKQPQIKISDLYSLPVPDDIGLQKKISNIIKKIYENYADKNELEKKLNKLIFNFYNLNAKEIIFIKKAISEFLKS
ncbi:Eco57I restriction-modification methylase domain-containing protein [Patescibacteria group bacterium]